MRAARAADMGVRAVSQTHAQAPSPMYGAPVVT